MQQTEAVIRTGSHSVEINKVLKNTYLLLSATLFFSAAMAWFAAYSNAQPMGIWTLLIGFYGLLFVVYKTANSSFGLLSTFAFTGFLGYSLGPILSYVSLTAPNILMTALGGTGLIFFSLSAYVLTTKKDMSFLSGMITAGFVVLLIAIIANLFLNIPAVGLAISVGIMMFSSAVILYQTSEIVRGGERNYILATVTLFVSLYNIFISLINLLMAFSGDD